MPPLKSQCRTDFSPKGLFPPIKTAGERGSCGHPSVGVTALVATATCLIPQPPKPLSCLPQEYKKRQRVWKPEGDGPPWACRVPGEGGGPPPPVAGRSERNVWLALSLGQHAATAPACPPRLSAHRAYWQWHTGNSALGALINKCTASRNGKAELQNLLEPPCRSLQCFISRQTPMSPYRRWENAPRQGTYNSWPWCHQFLGDDGRGQSPRQCPSPLPCR